MDSVRHRRWARQRRADERELLMVREAIAMVASGLAPRVTVAGIRHSEEILDRARRLALEAGVRVNRLSQQEDRVASLSVEPINE